MNKTKLSSKGQVIIPKPLRNKYQWQAGQNLIVIDTGDGILLKAQKPFSKTRLDQVAGCLKTDQAKSLAEMEQAIQQGIQNDCG